MVFMTRRGSSYCHINPNEGSIRLIIPRIAALTAKAQVIVLDISRIALILSCSFHTRRGRLGIAQEKAGQLVAMPTTMRMAKAPPSQTKDGIFESTFMTISFSLFPISVFGTRLRRFGKECHYGEIFAKHACANPCASHVIDLFARSTGRTACRKYGKHRLPSPQARRRYFRWAVGLRPRRSSK